MKHYLVWRSTLVHMTNPDPITSRTGSVRMVVLEIHGSGVQLEVDVCSLQICWLRHRRWSWCDWCLERTQRPVAGQAVQWV